MKLLDSYFCDSVVANVEEWRCDCGGIFPIAFATDLSTFDQAAARTRIFKQLEGFSTHPCLNQ